MLSEIVYKSDTKRLLYTIVSDLISKFDFDLDLYFNFLDVIMNNNRCIYGYSLVRIVCHYLIKR